MACSLSADDKALKAFSKYLSQIKGFVNYILANPEADAETIRQNGYGRFLDEFISEPGYLEILKKNIKANSARLKEVLTGW